MSASIERVPRGRGYPTCAVCGRPVERVTEARDDFTQRVRITVSCHGDREHVDLTFEELNDGAGERIRFGVAFATSPRRLST